MNKGDLVDAVASSTGDSKSGAAASLDAVLDSITSALKGGDRVQISGFGTFEVRARAARQGRNPQTGATIQIKASNAPAFKAGKALKEAVN
ncbi:MAG TPA: HU family DNA-binding protein [Actinobacteria bacterium]|nr:HU family DNA-binding protein [Actinomycetota bacterium]